MPSQAKFKPSALSHSMHLIFKMQGFPKLICGGFLISSCISVACAQEKITELAKNEALESSTTQLEAKTVAETISPQPQLDSALQTVSTPEQDSLAALKQQEQAANQIEELKPIQLEDNLEDLPTMTVDQGMADEIFRVAEEAKKEAQNSRDNAAKTPDVLVNDVAQLNSWKSLRLLSILTN